MTQPKGDQVGKMSSVQCTASRYPSFQNASVLLDRAWRYGGISLVLPVTLTNIARHLAIGAGLGLFGAVVFLLALPILALVV